jgi:uncharacterized protein DUF1559
VASAGLFGFAEVRVQRFDQTRATQAAIIDVEALTPEGAQRTVSTNNLKQIGIAMHNFHDTFNHFPIADGAGRDGKPKLSWRVHILPFIEQDALFKQFKLDEPWDSPNNKKLIEKMPKIYATPGSKVAQKHMTNYLTVRGKDTMFPSGKETSLARVTDGTSNTVMVLEVDDEHAVVWTRPDDFEPDKDDPLKGIVGLRNGKFLTLFGDASVRLLPDTLSKDTIRAIFTQAGGEVVNLPN